jgi:hypothetical protein
MDISIRPPHGGVRHSSGTRCRRRDLNIRLMLLVLADEIRQQEERVTKDQR